LCFAMDARRKKRKRVEQKKKQGKKAQEEQKKKRGKKAQAEQKKPAKKKRGKKVLDEEENQEEEEAQKEEKEQEEKKDQEDEEEEKDQEVEEAQEEEKDRKEEAQKEEKEQAEEGAREEMAWALPYVDEFTAEGKVRALALLAEERPAERDYLAHLPPTHEPCFTGAAAEAWSRVSTGETATGEGLDVRRYQMPPPTGTGVKNWTTALANAHTQLAHQSLRLTNLNLLGHYGSNAWLLHNQHLEKQSKRTTKALGQTQENLREVNSKRKTEQEETGQLLRKYAKEWEELVFKNHEIDGACSRLEREIAQLKCEKAVLQEDNVAASEST